MTKKKYSPQEEQTNTASEPIAACQYAPTPVPGKITVNIDDMSKLKDIKRAICMIRGVVSVEKSPAMKSYERARADVEAGRVIECNSKEEFFRLLNL